MSDFKAQVNNVFEFENLSLSELDIVPSGSGKFHILKDGRSYHAEIVHMDFVAKQFTIRINGSNYQVQLEDHYDQLVKQLGLEFNVQHKVKEIQAPMPGLVLEIEITVGQEVEEGDTILILEAMKMENIIKSPGDGVVKKIMVEKGQAVEKGGTLVVFE